MSRALVWLGIGLAACSMLSCAQRTPSAVEVATPQSATQLQGYAVAGVAAAPMGLYRLQVTPDAVSVLPERQVAATPGQLFQVDLTDALTSTFCRDCLQVQSFTRIPEGVRVELSLRHPFALANDAAPPSAKNRRDLWVSTVKGVLLTPGTESFYGDTVAANPAVLRSPDGYTTLIAPGVGEAMTAYPYQVFGASGSNVTSGNFDDTDGWGEHPDDPTGYLVLANDQTAKATYELRLEPGAILDVPLALTASFSPGATGLETRLIPNYFMPAGTPPEAWRVTTRVDGELDPFNTSSNVNLHLEVCDWQQAEDIEVDTNFPVVGDRERIPVSSRIAGVSLSLAALTGEDEITFDVAEGSGAGTVADPWQLNVPLKNSAAVGPGTYYGLVKVVDERDPASADAPYGTTTFIGPDLATPYAAPAEFATYAVVEAVVLGTPDCFPVFEVFHGEADLYIPGEPLYQLVRTKAELDTLLASLQSEPTEVLFDEAQSSVIVAVGGWYFAGRGQRDIDIVSVCQINNKLHIAIDRTEAVSGCSLTGAPTAPLEIAVIDSRNSSHVFNETLIDWCATACEPVAWKPLQAGDAAVEFGYDGELIDLYCADQGAYDTAITQLGMTNAPIVDFNKDIVWVLCAEALQDPQTLRYVEVLDICQVPGNGLYRVTWQHGEYVSCVADLGIKSAPYLLFTLPKNTGGGESTAYLDDICPFPYDCEPMIAPEAMFGDYQANRNSEPEAVYISTAFEYTPAWEGYFEDVPTRPAQPPVDFDNWDAVLLSSGFRLNGQTQRSIHVTQVCLDKTAGILHIYEQREEHLTCTDPRPPSNPWTLILVPDGGPYTLDRIVTTIDACGPTANCQAVSLVAAGPVSDYLDHASQTFYFGQTSYPERVAAFEDAWALVSSDPPPNMADWSPDEGRFLFLYGFRFDDLNGYKTRLESFCQDGSGNWVAEVARVSAPNDCVLPGIRNSAWSVYEVPLVTTSPQFDIELVEECPEP